MTGFATRLIPQIEMTCSISVKVFFLNPRLGDDGVEVPDDSEIKNQLGLTLPDRSNLGAIPLDFFLFVITQQKFSKFYQKLWKSQISKMADEFSEK